MKACKNIFCCYFIYRERQKDRIVQNQTYTLDESKRSCIDRRAGLVELHEICI